MLRSRRPLQAAYFELENVACLVCQWRSFSTTYRYFAEPPSKPALPTSSTSPALLSTDAFPNAPRSYGKSVDEFTPEPLLRPIGLPNPPQPGENLGIDRRTWRQRREDFVDYDKHVAKRKMLTQKMAKPYFRDFSNMRHHKGKTFLAPPRLFKSGPALYFPNLAGQTLLKDGKRMDTTPVLLGKVSVVSLFSSAWAENQAATFASEKSNPALHEAVKESGGLAQLIQINIEENTLKAMLIKLFMPGLRKRLGVHNWGRYFLVEKGMNDDIRDSIGLLNSKVGYTYLLDGECKIRWAGSGISEDGEKEGLVRGVNRLVEEVKLGVKR